MSLWKSHPTLEQLNQMGQNTAVHHLGVKITAITDDSLTASLPVDTRTIQPAGLMHGGCYAFLAETLGGIASSLMLEGTGLLPVGIEVQASHVKSTKSGFVHGTVKAVHLGNRLHLWEIRIVNDKGDLLSVAKITNQIISKT